MPHLAEDEVKVTSWNVEKMVESGLSPGDAIQLAEDGTDWHEVADLISRGCPTHLVLRILAQHPPKG